VSPHQTTLLKLVDAYLQPSQSRGLAADSRELRSLCEFLTAEFTLLALYTRKAISRALASANSDAAQLSGEQGSDTSTDSDTLTPGNPAKSPGHLDDVGSLRELDLLLPKVCEALVLVAQALTSLSLISEESAAPLHPPAPRGSPVVSSTGDRLRDLIGNATTPTGEGFVECLIGTITTSLE
jgi:ataxin-10